MIQAAKNASASFEDAVLKLQMAFEETGEDMAKDLAEENEDAVLIFDRGLLDPRVYMETGHFCQLLRSNRLTMDKIYNCYGLAIHMVSAAHGAPEHYGRADNTARSEDLTFALEIEKRTLEAWNGHPNRVIVPNIIDDRQITFKEKLQLTEKAVMDFLSAKNRTS